jgi:hypothetical protein
VIDLISIDSCRPSVPYSTCNCILSSPDNPDNSKTRVGARGVNCSSDSKDRNVLHLRCSWSVREDRAASAVWLGILWVGMIAGFGVDFPRYLHKNPPAPKITYLHGAIFTGWMLLLTAQVLLVVGDRVKIHRTLGWVTAGWGCLMAVFGPWAVIASDVVNLHSQIGDPPFLSVNIVDLAGFLILVGWGIVLRKNPAAHRRIMILSTVALADSGFSRFTAFLWPEPISVFPMLFLRSTAT